MGRRKEPIHDAPAALTPGHDRRALWVAIALGFGLRLAIAQLTIGTNDVTSFTAFGNLVRSQGLFDAYGINKDFNHPPLIGLWAEACWRIGEAFGRPIDPFFFLFKLPIIAADGLSAWVLYRLWAMREGKERGLAVAGLFAWAIAPILVSGYHGNTDPIYAALSLLAVYLLAEKRSPLGAGLALAAAVNVKLVPLILVPPLLASMRPRQDWPRFLAGLSVGVLPFLPLFYLIGGDFYRNALAYRSNIDRWGIQLPLTWGRPDPPDHPYHDAALWLQSYGRFLVLVLVGVWSVMVYRLRRWTAYEAAAIAYAIFLVLAPGFGVQYVVIIAPLLFATGVRLATVYSAAAGLFLFVTYVLLWDGGTWAGSFFIGYLPEESAVLGVGVWGILVWFLAWTVAGRMWWRSPPGVVIRH